MTPYSFAEQLLIECNGLRFEGPAQGAVNGKMVLFLHGFSDFADAWLQIMHPIAARGFRTVAVNQRGYSRMHGPAGLKITRQSY